MVKNSMWRSHKRSDPKLNDCVHKDDIKQKETSFDELLPRAIVDQMGNPKLAIGIDIETHGWPEYSSKKGHIGNFGFYTMKDDAAVEF